MNTSRVLFVLLCGIMFLLQVHVNQACNPCKQKKTTETITYRQIDDEIPREQSTTQMTNPGQHTNQIKIANSMQMKTLTQNNTETITYRQIDDVIPREPASQITNPMKHTNQIETTNLMHITSLTKKNAETISDREIDKITPLESIFLTLKPHYRMILHFLDVNDINTHLFVQMILRYKPNFFATMSIHNKYDYMFDLMFNKKYDSHLTYGKKNLKFWGHFNSTVSLTYYVAENFRDPEEFFFSLRCFVSNGVLQKRDNKYTSDTLMYDYQNGILTFPKTSCPVLNFDSLQKGQVLKMKKQFFPYVIIFTFYDQIPQKNFISNLQMIYLSSESSVYFIGKVHQHKVHILFYQDQSISIRMYTEDSDDNLYRRKYYYSFKEIRSQSQSEFKRHKFNEFSTSLQKFNPESGYYDKVSYSRCNFDQYINDNSILHYKNIYINGLSYNNQ